MPYHSGICNNSCCHIYMIKRLPAWVWFGGVLLSFTAGIINSVALLGFANQAVTHVTGSISLAAAAAVQQNWGYVSHLALVVFFFFLGAILSGLITQGNKLMMGRRYGVALLIESALLVIATQLFIHSSFWAQMVASMACGLQNAMVTTFSGAIIRTTHLTGLVTDLGAKIGHWLRGGIMDKRRLLLYVLLFSGFASGGVVGAYLFSIIGDLTLMVPAGITGISGFSYMLYAIKLRRENRKLQLA